MASDELHVLHTVVSRLDSAGIAYMLSGSTALGAYATPRDTAPEVAERYRAMLLALSQSERIVMACGLFDTARATVLASLPQGADEATRRVHLFLRTYGRDFDPELATRIVASLKKSAGA